MRNLSLKNVGKTFPGRISAVRNLSLDVVAGELLAMVGPSGCGKSTVLRLIAGLEEATEGEILLDGKNVTNLLPKERDIALVFQDYALYPHMTVFENMAFTLRMRRWDRKSISDRVEETAVLLGIEDVLSRRPGTLSGGQCQRVAIGRAIVRKPGVLLLDEPLSNLDPVARVGLRSELKMIQKNTGCTTVLVTHDQAEAMTLGDRIVVMANGECQQIGSPGAVYRRPINTFVSQFIGTPQMSLLQGELCKEDSGFCFTDGRKLIFPLGEWQRSSLVEHVGSSVVLGIRPEQIAIVKDASTRLHCVMAIIESAEDLGHETVLRLNCNSHNLSARIRNEVSQSTARVGEKVYLTIDTTTSPVFDSKTGANLLWEPTELSTERGTGHGAIVARHSDRGTS